MFILIVYIYPPYKWYKDWTSNKILLQSLTVQVQKGSKGTKATHGVFTPASWALAS